MTKWILLALVIATTSPQAAQACTTFCSTSDAGPLVGKSYDWHLGDGHAVVNKRGVKKTALVLQGAPASWTSRYGSLTFNQYGREFPNGGMNEKGLVVEIMWLDTSEYPKPDKRPTINELQWIQYQLDSYSTVAEVVAHAGDIRVAPVTARVHFMACDKSGACATFEYVGGKMVVTAGKKLRSKVLTNDTYAEGASFLRKHKGFGGSRAIPRGESSKQRFVIASHGARKLGRRASVANAFAVLDRVRQGDFSKWHIVYEPKSGRVHFRTLTRTSVKTVNLSRFDFDCRKPTVFLDLASKAKGEVTRRFAAWTPVANRDLVQRNMVNAKVPKLLISIAAAYPASTQCLTAP